MIQKLEGMKVKELRELAGKKNISGRWDMSKPQLVAALFPIMVAERNAEIAEEQAQQATVVAEEETPIRSNKGRVRTINIYKDGEQIKVIDGLLETFKWATENGIANQGWVKESLKTGRETTAGRKFKEGGYRFEYAE